MSTGQAIFEEVGRCSRCWRLFNISLLTKQNGKLLCTVSCLDDLSNTHRAKQISDILSSSSDGVSDKPEIFSDPGEISFE